MSKRNRQRRQQKQRQRRLVSAGRVGGPSGASARAAGGSGAGPSGFDLQQAQYLFVQAASQTGILEDAVNVLAEEWPLNTVVPLAAGRCLERALAAAWPNGWQPADVHRVVARRLGASHASLLVQVMAADASRYRDRAGADQAWLAQLEDVGARRWWSSSQPHLMQWARRAALTPAGALRLAVELFTLLNRLPRLQRLCVPPDEWDATASSPLAGRTIDPKILDRVRALLAKAESTTFPEEAEALTAKAQELIARHAIETAMLDDGGQQRAPIARRVGIDDPYASAKAFLLTEVAAASRCRSVWSQDFGFSTVFGFPAEVDAVELLFTSLLVQATTAMVAEGKRPEQRRQRSRSFRHSFLVAFAARIGQRLRETTEAVVSEASSGYGGTLLPVLASRSDAVDAACQEMFPQVKGCSLAAKDQAGWVAGTVAANLASLAVGPELKGRS